MLMDRKKYVLSLLTALMIIISFVVQMNNTPSTQNALPKNTEPPRQSPGDDHRGPARFEKGRTTWLKTFSVGTQGGTWEVDNAGTIPYPFMISVPANAVDKDTEISVGYNDGDLYLPTGREAGPILVLHAETRSFKEPVSVTFKADIKRLPVGYAIQENGTLRPMDTVWDKLSGDLKFYTFGPVTMTWVHAK
jgi:hypothetical protein